jgi:hypothetical protein
MYPLSIKVYSDDNDNEKAQKRKSLKCNPVCFLESCFLLKHSFLFGTETSQLQRFEKGENLLEKI